MEKSNPRRVTKLDFIILGIIILVALAFRLYKINTPLADLHSWRQVDTASVARNYVKNGIDLLKPVYDDLSPFQTNKDNPLGLRFVEFPIYNTIVAIFSGIIPGRSVTVSGRLVTIFFSLTIIAIIYYLALKESSRLTAVISAGVYAVFPFFVFFSRVVLPETTALAFAMFAIFFLYLWRNHEKQNKLRGIVYFIFSFVFFAIALLIKPTVVFYAIPLLYLFWQRYEFSTVFKPTFYLYFILSAIPFLLWRLYIQNFPEGIPASAWLITSVNTYEGQKNIFFRPAFFRWIFFERINNLMLGGYLTVLFVLGFFAKTRRYFFHSLLFGTFAYLFTFQGGNIQHEYYQTLIFPAIAIFVGLGVDTLLKIEKNIFGPALITITIVFIFASSFYFSYFRVKDWYNYPNDLTQIAKIISTITTESDKIVTDRDGDTTLLYLSNRRGSPSPYKDLSLMKQDGYKYFITDKKYVIEALQSEKKFTFIFQNDQFAIVKL